MAKAPSFIDKVNTILRVFSNPCDPPWVLYVETFFPAAGNLLLTLLSFGWDDVVRGYLRPRKLRTQPHGRRKRRRRGGGIPELGEMIGSNLPGAEKAKGRSVQAGVAKLWIIDGVIQRGLWWWLVADALFEFAYDWASGILREQVCALDGNASKLVEDDNVGNGGTGNWTGVFGALTVVYARNMEPATATMNFGKGNGIVVVSAKMTAQQNGGWFQLGIAVKGTAMPDDGGVTGPRFDLAPFQTAESIVTLDVGPDDRVTTAIIRGQSGVFGEASFYGQGEVRN